MTKLDEFQSAWECVYRCVCGLSIGDIEPDPRSQALRHLDQARDYIVAGIEYRETERRLEEDARIMKAYREGRLVEVMDVRTG